MPDEETDVTDVTEAGETTEIESVDEVEEGAEDNGDGEDDQPLSPLRENVATIMAVVVIVALGIFYAYMLRNIEVDQLYWDRGMTILGGVEAIVFAAAGFLFGTTIQRKVSDAQVETEKENAEQARTDKEKAEADAKEKQKQADEGKVLAGMVMGQTPERTAGGPPGTPDKALASDQVRAGVSNTVLTQAQKIIDS